ncbi:MAG: hypothetical protein PHT69_17000, partial [Bacteroidales bacterium]|nr:hypothetical protein [Bacteroidales bacterium]
MRNPIFFILFFLLLSTVSFSQNVGINADGSNPDPAAMLDIKSSDKGLLIPRVDFTALPVTPPAGLLVYVTTNGPDGDNAFYYYNGTQWTRFSTFAGLENFTESNYSYDSKTGVKLQADNIATNVDLVLQPKGSGALLARQPDGTYTGGNARGLMSVDLQLYANQPDMVASGNGSVISGGSLNKASGMSSTISGGYWNAATGLMSFIGAGGKNISSSDYSSVGGGYQNTASGNYSTVSGGYNSVAGNTYATVSGGYNNSATGISSTIL